MLELRSVSKSFSNKPIVREVSFRVADGEVVALLGPSGSGKSTLLSLIAGLEVPDAGQILWNGADQSDVPAHRRGFGLMFQDFALFPHRNVAGNVAFGLEMAARSQVDIVATVEAALARVGLSGFESRDVGSLSGGEQQRVALARALAPQPRLLMLDEPLGSLDRALRSRLLGDLAGILRLSGQSSLYVTHDQEEAYAIADRIVVLNVGQVAQIGAPEQLYRTPASAFVANFLGLRNLFPAQLISTSGKRLLKTALGEFAAPTSELSGEVTMLLRPDALRLDATGPAVLRGKVSSKQFRGSQVELDLALDLGAGVQLELPSGTRLPTIGEQVAVSFDPATAIQVFPRE